MTCVLDWYDWEPDQICFEYSIGAGDPIKLVHAELGDPTPPLAYIGLVQLTFPTGHHSLAVGVGFTGPCQFYDALECTVETSIPLRAYDAEVTAAEPLCLYDAQVETYLDENTPLFGGPALVILPC